MQRRFNYEDSITPLEHSVVLSINLSHLLSNAALVLNCIMQGLVIMQGRGPKDI